MFHSCFYIPVYILPFLQDIQSRFFNDPDYLCVYLTSFIIPFHRILSLECKIEQPDFTDCMLFLISNFMEEIYPNPEALTRNN